MIRLLFFCLLAATVVSAQGITPSPTPRASLVRVERLSLSGTVDSNSPVAWDRINGFSQVFVVTSVGGQPSRARGASLQTLGRPAPVTLEPWPGGGVWMESIVADEGGVWYGFYHNENPATMCGETNKNYPRIGAARSEDRGATWTDLGIILESSYRSFDCDTSNQYFVGGYGDFSAILDAEHRDIYFYFSQYGRRIRQQGIALGRLAWADRDAPVGKLMVWNAGAWLPPMRGMPRGEETESGRWKYPMASSIFETRLAWHDEDTRVDAFWGPSVHWNTYLRQYVMLMNRSKDETFAQEGIYVSFSPRLDDPAAWTAPAKILNGGAWYPQVIGTMPGVGTDTVTGQVARFFMKGISEYVIQFER